MHTRQCSRYNFGLFGQGKSEASMLQHKHDCLGQQSMQFYHSLPHSLTCWTAYQTHLYNFLFNNNQATLPDTRGNEGATNIIF